MKKLVIVALLVAIAISVLAPAAFAQTQPPGNNTNVTVYGYRNRAAVDIAGWGNNTNLYFGWHSKYNRARIAVNGCYNTTNVTFGKGAKGNKVRVSVSSPCIGP